MTEAGAKTIIVINHHIDIESTDTHVMTVDMSTEDARTIFSAGQDHELMAVIEGSIYAEPYPTRFDVEDWCRKYLASAPRREWSVEEQCWEAMPRTIERMSDARIRAMELGLNPWPSASGWAPPDLPWKERRLLISIVEGVASLARWAHEIWERDHPPPACDVCGEPDCPA